jgi:hypothetical protein
MPIAHIPKLNSGFFWELIISIYHNKKFYAKDHYVGGVNKVRLKNCENSYKNSFGL